MDEEELAKLYKMMEERDNMLQEFANRLEIPLIDKKVYKWKIKVKPNEKYLANLDDKKKELLKKALFNEVLYNWDFYNQRANKLEMFEPEMMEYFETGSSMIQDIREKQLKLI